MCTSRFKSSICQTQWVLPRRAAVISGALLDTGSLDSPISNCTCPLTNRDSHVL